MSKRWKRVPVGDWFFVDSPECRERYSVQLRTDGGAILICSTPWHTESAKRDMQMIARLHNLHRRLAERIVKIATKSEQEKVR